MIYQQSIYVYNGVGLYIVSLVYLGPYIMAFSGCSQLYSYMSLNSAQGNHVPWIKARTPAQHVMSVLFLFMENTVSAAIAWDFLLGIGCTKVTRPSAKNFVEEVFYRAYACFGVTHGSAQG